VPDREQEAHLPYAVYGPGRGYPIARFKLREDAEQWANGREVCEVPYVSQAQILQWENSRRADLAEPSPFDGQGGSGLG
jgi:hypothetical protein